MGARIIEDCTRDSGGEDCISTVFGDDQLVRIDPRLARKPGRWKLVMFSRWI